MRKNWVKTTWNKEPRLKNEPNLEETLWRWFSLYVRLLYSDRNGYVKCYTCGAIHHYKQMDAGHYISRNYRHTKFDERNVKPQCKKCNRFQSGQIAFFATKLQQEYGKDILIILEIKAQRGGNNKLTEFDMIALLDHYKREVKLLRSVKTCN